MNEKEWAFDRYRDGVRMAQGCRVHASTKDEAIQKARQLFDYEDYTFVERAKPSTEPEAAPDDDQTAWASIEASRKIARGHAELKQELTRVAEDQNLRPHFFNRIGESNMCADCDFRWTDPIHLVGEPRMYQAPASEAQAPAACGALHTTTEGDVYACVRDSGHEDYHSSVRDSIRIATGGVFWWDRTPRTQAPAVLNEAKSIRRARERIAETKRIAVGSDVHLMEMLLTEIASLREKLAKYKNIADAVEGYTEYMNADGLISAFIKEQERLRDELAQLRARVAILDAQEVKLPASAVEERRLDGEYQTGKEYLDDRVAELERQLLDSQRAIQAQRTIMCDLRNGLVAARDFIDSGDSGWFPQKWRDAIAAYDALAGRDGE